MGLGHSIPVSHTPCQKGFIRHPPRQTPTLKFISMVIGTMPEQEPIIVSISQHNTSLKINLFCKPGLLASTTATTAKIHFLSL